MLLRHNFIHHDGKFEIVTFCQLYSSHRVLQYNTSNKRIFYDLQYLYKIILLKMLFMGPNLRKCMVAVIIFSAILLFLQLHLSHSHSKYVKQQVISCSTTLVYHSHIEKCDLGVEKLNKLNSWRPFWKISCNLFSSPN